MKKFLVFICAVLFLTACQRPQNNKGYGYGMTATATETLPKEDGVLRGHVRGLGKYGSPIDICSAYYGEFNGHTWYVFYDNLAVPAVVHDPLCTCGGGK